MATPKSEQETNVRWDQEERVLHLFTAHPATARKWTKLGYLVEAVSHTEAGKPRGWRARAPVDALRFRRLVNGQLVSRRRGRSFGHGPRKSADSEQRNPGEQSEGLTQRPPFRKAAN